MQGHSMPLGAAVPVNAGFQKACVHTAGGILLLMGLALLPVAGWVPPILPALDAEAIQAIFLAETNNIRLAAVLLMLGSVLFWPFAAAIGCQMKRVEGPHFHPLASTQLASASGTVIAILLPAACWMVAAYRPERSAEAVQLMNDFGWILFIGTAAPGFLQLLCIAGCALSEKGPKRVFPRWFGFFNLWAATGFLMGELVCFFHTGAFAWDGYAAFWMAAVFFFGWILVTWWVVARCIDQQAAEAELERSA